MPAQTFKREAALVTGASQRVGKTIALKLAAMGFDIALHYQSSIKDAARTAQEIKRSGVRCALFNCDFTKEEETCSLVGAVKEIFPRLALLINNASIFEPSTIKRASLDNFNRHWAINLKAPWILTQTFAKLCRQGQIINILDTHITRHKTKYAAYLLSKKALSELTKLAAVELAPNIRVNAIAPGLILPPANEDKSYLERLAQNVPLKKKGDVDQIAQTIEFLINNPYLTGQIIFNDGGEHLL